MINLNIDIKNSYVRLSNHVQFFYQLNQNQIYFVTLKTAEDILSALLLNNINLIHEFARQPISTDGTVHQQRYFMQEDIKILKTFHPFRYDVIVGTQQLWELELNIPDVESAIVLS